MLTLANTGFNSASEFFKTYLELYAFFGTEALFERDFPIFENSDTGKRAKRREKWKNRARDDI